MRDGANVRDLNTAATLWCSAAVGACAGAGELLDGVVVMVLLIAINSILRPLSRYIDRKSLAAVDIGILFRIRLSCEPEYLHDLQDKLTRAIAERSLILRDLVTEKEKGSCTQLVAIIESHSKQFADLKTSMREGLPGAASIEVIAKKADSE